MNKIEAITSYVWNGKLYKTRASLLIQMSMVVVSRIIYRKIDRSGLDWNVDKDYDTIHAMQFGAAGEPHRARLRKKFRRRADRVIEASI